MSTSFVEQIGRYRITRVLGQGGMGTVYAGHDDRLDRPVAIKVLRTDIRDDVGALERFRREARAAARVNHPNICALYEFDEADGQPFLVMELLEGEPLSTRLARGAMPADKVMPLAKTMLDALAALHRRGIIHRDLKPANVFLTPHGLKLLDFGLAQHPSSEDATRETGLTTRGTLAGTPQYMAPEQLQGQTTTERSDIFASAAVVYEMLAGRPAFPGRTIVEIIHAVVYTEPPPLAAFPGSAAIDRALRQALVKDPGGRVARAEELSALLRDAALETDTTPARPVRQTRFVALPFRIMRPDPETDFLAFSVPDAVSSGLAAIASVTVRSMAATGATTGDIRTIGRELSVDVVLTGTILRVGPHVRVTAQLGDATTGNLIVSDTMQAPIDDLFQLQDTITARIVSSLSLPLTAGDRRALGRQAPASAEAYELFIRANQLMTDTRQWDEARKLYERAVVIDPGYAPAWAGLGRARRMLAKWGGSLGVGLLPHAETAFRRALELDPDLSSVHHLVAHVDAELGRAPEAMVRLLQRVAVRPDDPGAFSGLVTTCRYVGLLDASLAAHRRAHALDPAFPTSVAWTHLLRGDYDRAIATDQGAMPYAALMARLITGRLSSDALRPFEEQAGSASIRQLLTAYRHMIERQLDAARVDLEGLGSSGFADPEGWYIAALALSASGAPHAAIGLLVRAVEGGYVGHQSLQDQPEWQELRGDPTFERQVRQTAALAARATQMFNEAGGLDLLRPDRP